MNKKDPRLIRLNAKLNGILHFDDGIAGYAAAGAGGAGALAGGAYLRGRKVIGDYAKEKGLTPEQMAALHKEHGVRGAMGVGVEALHDDVIAGKNKVSAWFDDDAIKPAQEAAVGGATAEAAKLAEEARGGFFQRGKTYLQRVGGAVKRGAKEVAKFRFSGGDSGIIRLNEKLDKVLSFGFADPDRYYDPGFGTGAIVGAGSLAGASYLRGHYHLKGAYKKAGLSPEQIKEANNDIGHFGKAGVGAGVFGGDLEAGKEKVKGWFKGKPKAAAATVIGEAAQVAKAAHLSSIHRGLIQLNANADRALMAARMQYDQDQRGAFSNRNIAIGVGGAGLTGAGLYLGGAFDGKKKPAPKVAVAPAVAPAATAPIAPPPEVVAASKLEPSGVPAPVPVAPHAPGPVIPSIVQPVDPAAFAGRVAAANEAAAKPFASDPLFTKRDPLSTGGKGVQFGGVRVQKKVTPRFVQNAAVPGAFVKKATQEAGSVLRALSARDRLNAIINL